MNERFFHLQVRNLLRIRFGQQAETGADTESPSAAPVMGKGKDFLITQRGRLQSPLWKARRSWNIIPCAMPR